MKRQKDMTLEDEPLRSIGVVRGHQGQKHWNYNHRKLANLITRTTALSNSMKLSHAHGANQDGWVMVERSGRMWSTGEGNGKPLQYSCLENPVNSMKRQKIGHWKMNSPGQWVSSMLLEISGEITPERMKRLGQSRSDTQLWMCLVVKVKSDALKNNIAEEPGMLGPWIKANWKHSNRIWQ